MAREVLFQHTCTVAKCVEAEQRGILTEQQAAYLVYLLMSIRLQSVGVRSTGCRVLMQHSEMPSLL